MQDVNKETREEKYWAIFKFFYHDPVTGPVIEANPDYAWGAVVRIYRYLKMHPNESDTTDWHALFIKYIKKEKQSQKKKNRYRKNDHDPFDDITTEEATEILDEIENI